MNHKKRMIILVLMSILGICSIVAGIMLGGSTSVLINGEVIFFSQW